MGCIISRQLVDQIERQKEAEKLAHEEIERLKKMETIYLEEVKWLQRHVDNLKTNADERENEMKNQNESAKIKCEEIGSLQGELARLRDKVRLIGEKVFK